MVKIKEVSVSYNVKLGKDYNSIGTSIGLTADVLKGQNPDTVEKILRKKCRQKLQKEVKALAAFLVAASNV